MRIREASSDEDGSHVRLLLEWSPTEEFAPLLHLDQEAQIISIDVTLTAGESRDLEATLALMRSSPFVRGATPPPPSMKADRGFSG